MSKKGTETLRDIADTEKLNIPVSEIWTYQIEGLQCPRIVDKTVKTKTKVLIIVFLLIAISLSVFFSIRAVSNEEFDYSQTENGYELIKYSNPGSTTEVNIDYVNEDKNSPVTAIHEFAFNCDEKIKTVHIGKDVEKIDGKSFYSCWNLESVSVDENNPCYCDIDGVLYDKELTEIIYYPSAHDLYLTRKAGYKTDFPDDGSITIDDFSSAVNLLKEKLNTEEKLTSLSSDETQLLEKLKTVTGLEDYEKFLSDYEKNVGTYLLPSTVKTVGKLAFAYSDIMKIYLPAGLERIETLAFFKAEKLSEIYSYETADKNIPTSVDDLSGTVISLPNGLTYIGSDAFSYDRELDYMFIPSTVTEIGHHAFYSTAFKSNDEIIGLSTVNIEASEEDFSSNVRTGETWIPKTNAGLFEKNVEVIYSAERDQ